MNSTTDIIRAIIRMKKTWAGHVACRRGKVHTEFTVVKPEGKILFGETSCGWKDNIKWVLRKSVGRAQDKDVAPPCEHGSELSVSIKRG
jgi:hypothetical protein